PFQFLMRHGGFRSDVPSCVLLGLRHGGYCVGCCWVLMALLFVGGVMNVLWIALLALLVLLEKLTPIGRWIARAAGAACVAAGCCFLSQSLPPRRSRESRLSPITTIACWIPSGTCPYSAVDRRTVRCCHAGAMRHTARSVG